MGFLYLFGYKMTLQPGNLLRYHGFKFVTSSLEKKELELKVEKEKELAEDEANAAAEDEDVEMKMNADGDEAEAEGNRISTAAYHIVASAASYFHSHRKIILSFKSSKSELDENSLEDNAASFVATTDSVTAAVAAEEEVKQAMADDLNSTLSSPCEWFICDDDQNSTRFFVVQVEQLSSFTRGYAYS